MFESIYCAEKHRVSKDKLEVIITSEIDSSKSITVVDDLCDGGGTFFAIHKALQELKIYLCVLYMRFRKSL